MSIIETLHGPHNLKALSFSELHVLAAELRELIVAAVSSNGGHLASNLGAVELTLALHRVFDTPHDSIIWDVGHQCYSHKILTGRRETFHTIRREGGLSGFPKRSESIHDAFDVGHASTSVSAALGLLAARRINQQAGSVIAVLGDGALTGGLVYEAMSHAGQLGLPLIIVLNDNSMSISANVGAMSRYLSRLSATVRYQQFRRFADKAILGVPYFGPRLHPYVLRAKRSIKALFFKENLFADLGFEYAGPIDGHNIALLCDVLTQAKRILRPVVIHVVTRKGLGHPSAEGDPATWHGVAPPVADPSGMLSGKPRTFTDAFGAAMLDLARDDRRVVAISAAMAKGTGLQPFQERYPDRFFDVGIAEDHAVTMAAGMAAGGLRPVVAIYSTFMQRAFDQVHHDVALCSYPVIFALDRAGAVPDDGETHQGLYDIQAFRAVPGLTMVAPASAEELTAVLRWALTWVGPVMLRFPKALCPNLPGLADLPLVPGQGVFVRRTAGARSLVVTSGAQVAEALTISALADDGVPAPDVYHLRFLKPLDTAVFLAAVHGYERIIFAEEGVLTGSVAVDLANLVKEAMPGSAVRALGFAERPLAHMSRGALLAAAGLTAAGMRQVLQELEP
jgi:1-deoxy-D-xylulose-5-phosphate synthase